ncbi:1658_t:CDS:10 [Entrophospora sp. SA101]|nr:1658_t:CDS:10 [Entrophospora sp. SA101]
MHQAILPDDLIQNVLALLPIRKTYTLKRVCKAWNSLCDHAILEHINLNNSKVLIKLGPNSISNLFVTLDCVGYDPSNGIFTFKPAPNSNPISCSRSNLNQIMCLFTEWLGLDKNKLINDSEDGSLEINGDIDNNNSNVTLNPDSDPHSQELLRHANFKLFHMDYIEAARKEYQLLRVNNDKENTYYLGDKDMILKCHLNIIDKSSSSSSTSTSNIDYTYNDKIFNFTVESFQVCASWLVSGTTFNIIPTEHRQQIYSKHYQILNKLLPKNNLIDTDGDFIRRDEFEKAVVNKGILKQNIWKYTFVKKYIREPDPLEKFDQVLERFVAAEQKYSLTSMSKNDNLNGNSPKGFLSWIPKLNSKCIKIDNDDGSKKPYVVVIKSKKSELPLNINQPSSSSSIKPSSLHTIYEDHIAWISSENQIESTVSKLKNESTIITTASYLGLFKPQFVEEILSKRDDVEIVEPDSEVEVAYDPYDYHNLNTENGGSEEDYYYNNDEIDYKLNDDDVNIYVIDTGININHPDFQGRASWGVTIKQGSPNIDDYGHGTHVAGIIAAARVIAVKALGRSANAAIKALTNLGIHVTVAAGNYYGANACAFSPASSSEAITTGSTNIDDMISKFSNVGPCIDIFAPGEDIYSTWIGLHGSKLLSGTSMASPHVAGAIALIISEKGNMSPEKMKSMIVKLATRGVLKNTESTNPPSHNKLLYVNI